MITVRAYAWLLSFLVCPWIALAQPDTIQQKQFRVTPLPVISYAPETKLGFGALAAATFNLSFDSLTTASYAQTVLFYTLNNQYNFDNSVRIYASQNRLICQGRFSLTYFPELYYGIETEHPKLRRDLIEYNRLLAEFKTYKLLRRHTYLGLATRYSKVYNIFSAAGGSFLIDKPVGYTDHQILGFGPLIAFENRDSQVFPGKGWYAETHLITYSDWLHQSFSFVNVRFDIRKYYSIQWLSNRDVLALQIFGHTNSGTVPFKSMAEIGGSVVMRGYYTGYYRYKNLYAFQLEYRTALWKFIGANIWFGAALTPKQWYSIGDSAVKPNGGVGLRFMINEVDKLNLRADYGFGKQQQHGFYLDLAEAF